MNARSRSKQLGFTIVEIIVVVIVIAILAVITVVSYNGVTQRAHSAATATNVVAYVNALESMQLHEGTIYKGTGCVGGDTAQSCWLSLSYQGPGCSAHFGGNVPADAVSSPRNAAFDEKMASYLGSVPEKVQTEPFKAPVTIAENCSAVYSISGAIYQSYNKIVIKADGSIVFTSNADQSGDDAWAIMYRVPGANSECSVANSVKAKPDAFVELAGGNYTTCYVVQGDVVYE